MPQLYWRDRLFEWVMAAAMLGLGLEITAVPSTIEASAFRDILRVVYAEHLGLFFLFFGLLRALALVANGAWPKYGPRMRAGGAGAGALVWSQLGASLLLLAPFNNGIPSPGIPVYLALAVGELVSAYRAMSDARPPR